MRNTQGGTQIYCPHCKVVTVCKAINPSYFGEGSGQRWSRVDHNDIQWFRRGRVCLDCGAQFLTAELDEEFVTELVELRDALSEIKKNSEAYISESKAAAKSLEKLSNSLDILRALRIYRNV